MRNLSIRSSIFGPASLAVILLGLIAPIQTFASYSFTTSDDGQTMSIEDAPEMKVIAVAKDVVVKGSAKEVFSWGGDIVIEGRVSGDVATIGGNIIQKADGYVGGDVIVLGGNYRSDSANPLREAGRQTFVLGAFETELRGFAQNPSSLLAPSFTSGFFAQRIVSIIFWFVLTLIVVALAPRASARLSARLQLESAKVLGAGIAGLVLVIIGVAVMLSAFPEYLSSVIALMAMVFLFFCYGLGRIAAHVLVGKAIQKKFPDIVGDSNAVAIVIGVFFSTLFISIPYLWPVAVLTYFSAGIGIIILGRPGRSEQLVKTRKY